MGNRRVLFVAPSAHVLGGIPVWLDCLLPGLQARGWDCTLGLASGAHHDDRVYLRAHPWHQSCVFRNKTGSRRGREDALISLISDVGPSIVVGVNIADCYGATRRLKRSHYSAPRFVSSQHAIQGSMVADVLANADVCDAVVVTNMLLRECIAEQVRDERLLYAPYGVALPQSFPAPHRNCSRSEVHLLFAGRLDEGQKRILDIARIVQAGRARSLKVVVDIAGTGPDENLLRSFVERGALGGAFRFVGALSQRGLVDTYRNYDALLVTSEWETGPIVIWEAMAHGLPVITSRYTGAGAERALLDDKNCLMFDVGDIESAVEAIERLVAPGRRVQLAREGRRLIESRYTLEKSADAWAQAMEQVKSLPAMSRPSACLNREREGRLDTMFGSMLGEAARRLLRMRFLHAEPGAEWPHTYSVGMDERAFMAASRAADKRWMTEA